MYEKKKSHFWENFWIVVIVLLVIVGAIVYNVKCRY